MPKWTEEQSQAINTIGSNIIVSAGAGSGKTAVLTERVITLLKSGIKINELLILTFTNAAAGEMKDRIRSAILENSSLKDNLELIENSYITTFDSFTLSLVRKYHYLLNVSNDFNIVDSGIISFKRSEIIDALFDNYYQSNNSLFNKLINDFCIKNDKNIKSAILKIINGIDLIYDKDSFFDHYLDNYYSHSKIEEYLNSYLKLIDSVKEDINTNLLIISEVDNSGYYDDISKVLEPLLKAKSYEEYKNSINISLPKLPSDSDDIKEYKEHISDDIKLLKDYLRFDSESEIKESLNISKDYIIVILDIIRKYYELISDYKDNNNVYEFNDIELMAIRLLEDNDNIREEIKQFYHEIMVDEYQDTNDVQEHFVSLIANNNVYTVGDIKQSIYGFRNANPLIFQAKYDQYSLGLNGVKIDLTKNFRSRKEVLEAINYIFNMIMDNEIGGAEYIQSHQMKFGNTMYEENQANQNYNLEIISYNEYENYTKEEIEAFTIAYDIKQKIKDKYQVVDKKTKTLRDCSYQDFCIIMDRGSAFDIYKKIFEYNKVPLCIYQDKKLNTETDIMVLNNVIGLIVKIDKQIFDKEFEYLFMSVGRSFLFEYSDQELFNYLTKHEYSSSELYQKAEGLVDFYNQNSSSRLINEIIDQFDFYSKIIKVGNVEDTNKRVDNLIDIAISLEKLGYTSQMLFEYIQNMIENGVALTYKESNVDIDAVKIMNIHKSKGLEFPICYFSGLYKEFNNMDIKDRFLYDTKYSIVTPYFNEGIGNTIIKDLVKSKYIINNISERIRLFYVALTRAKEKIILVNPVKEGYRFNNQVPYEIRSHYKSFADIVNSINLEKYSNIIDLNKIGLSKGYLKNNIEKLIMDNDDRKIIYHDITIENNVVTKKHASKTINSIIDESNRKVLEYGTHMHELFECANFLNIPDDYPEKEKIKNFVKNFDINKDTKIYKEHEFYFEEDNTKFHGIIDLVLVNPNEVVIIDYKLKNVDDDKYVDQLKVYFNYLKSIFKDKEIKTYLYSILNDELKKVSF